MLTQPPVIHLQVGYVINTTSIKWNFTKFLVDRNGYPLERFGTTTKPESLESSIEKALLAAK
eukprot:m.303693 g.303693  ORF g.303693 m.303693 type:complete len:62 (+) comp27304_c1_seq8:414-599(+)